jgi:hypothetical protein
MPVQGESKEPKEILTVGRELQECRERHDEAQPAIDAGSYRHRIQETILRGRERETSERTEEGAGEHSSFVHCIVK